MISSVIIPEDSDDVNCVISKAKFIGDIDSESPAASVVMDCISVILLITFSMELRLILWSFSNIDCH